MKAIRMSLAEVRRRINRADLDITIEQRLPNNLGTQLVTLLGRVVTVYDTHTVVLGGKKQMQMRKIKLCSPRNPPTLSSPRWVRARATRPCGCCARPPPAVTLARTALSPGRGGLDPPVRRRSTS
jgi:hypothetical protein